MRYITTFTQCVNVRMFHKKQIIRGLYLLILWQISIIEFLLYSLAEVSLLQIPAFFIIHDAEIFKKNRHKGVYHLCLLIFGKNFHEYYFKSDF
jgi:hypothetical protein